MNKTIWSDLHKDYSKQDWITKPSIFAETAITYFPAQATVLDLGAGLGQDSRYFAEHGYTVTSTDLQQDTLDKSQAALPDDLRPRLSFQHVDLREELPFGDASFDVVYAHLSIHYFTKEVTTRLIGEIQRVLKPGGIFAFLVNTVDDPEYNTGQQIEPDYFQVGDATKRYFSVASAREMMRWYDTILVDNHGETYKDADKGIHNLIRYIGAKPQKQEYALAIPFCGAIIERQHNGQTELLMQTRWKPHADPVYSGTLEFPAGALDKPFEDVHRTVAREIQEECGLTLKAFKNDTRNEATTLLGTAIGFRPYCCVQQIAGGKPWAGFIFVCEVEPGQEPQAQLSEAKDAQWMPLSEVATLVASSPEKIFGLELPALQYYLDEHQTA
jgi:SAM-dependent methyltransferase